MKANEIKEREILNELKNFHKKDIAFSSGKIFKEVNLGDKRISEGATEIEKECVRWVGKILNLNLPGFKILENK